MKPLIAIFLLLASLRSQAAIIMAASASPHDFSNAVALAVSGDTVVVPAGTGDWTKTLIIFSKNISIIGAGIGQTIWVDDIIATDNASMAILRLDTYGTNLTRVSGIEFRRGTQSVQLDKGVVWFSGNCSSIRCDHCAFNNLRNIGVYFTGSSVGVVDHCSFSPPANGHASEVWHIGWPPAVDPNWGDGSWVSPVQYGSTNMVVFEDCYFVKTTGTGVIDLFAGARACVRYSIFTNCYWGGHGTESSIRYRGARWMESYKNQFYFNASGLPVNFTAHDYRSGGGVVWSNTIVGTVFPVTCSDQRMLYSVGPWLIADGKNVWDVNSNGVFASGTHKGAPINLEMMDTNASFTPHQYIGYSILNTNTGRASMIIDNGTTDIQYNGAANIQPNMTFSDGQGYEIRYVDVVIDGVGRGSGDQITGGSVSPVPVGWPHQSPDPVYAWSNTYNPLSTGGANRIYNGGYNVTIVEGREIFNDTPKPGYTPLIYPHPLVSSSTNTPPPTPPASVTLRIVSYQGRVLTSVGKQ